MKIGAIVTSYDGHLYCLSETLLAVKMAVDVLVCGYDIHERLPNFEHIKACDHFFVCRDYRLVQSVSPRRKQIGDIMQTRLGIEYLKDRCDCILKMDGDVMLEEPLSNIKCLAKQYLANYDFILSRRADTKYFGTTLFLGTTRAVADVYKAMNLKGRPRVEEQLGIMIKAQQKEYFVMTAKELNSHIKYYRVKNKNSSL